MNFKQNKQRNYSYYSHKDCEYFPCHPNANPDNFNCLFCYCPLYLLGEQCGGTYSFLEGGIKDCSACLYPHARENYEQIVARYGEIVTAMSLRRTSLQTKDSVIE